MKYTRLFVLSITLIFIFSSCANYRLNYSHAEKDWRKNQPIDTTLIEHTMFLIGDAGNSKKGKPAPSLKLLKHKLSKASKNSSVIFLGDNIYPGGLPPNSNAADRKEAESKLDAQLNALKKFKGHPIFLPGNHDWRYEGLKGVQRQEDYIEKALNKGLPEDEWGNYFLPDDGCGGPEIVELNDNLVVVIVDSQWYLTDWDTEPEINDGCEAKSRKVFAFLMEEMLRKYRRKNVVIAMHHPLYTAGPHGGYFTAKQHLFPLTDLNENAYIPLPGIGSIAAFLRGTVGTKSDVAHHKYKAFKDDILFGAKKNGPFIIASGHEHNLQYIERDNQYQIVSGNGSKQNPCTYR